MEFLKNHFDVIVIGSGPGGEGRFDCPGQGRQVGRRRGTLPPGRGRLHPLGDDSEQDPDSHDPAVRRSEKKPALRPGPSSRQGDRRGSSGHHSAGRRPAGPRPRGFLRAQRCGGDRGTGPFCRSPQCRSHRRVGKLPPLHGRPFRHRHRLPPLSAGRCRFRHSARRRQRHDPADDANSPPP